jgi:hypothetical protein
MANALYPKNKAQKEQGAINMLTADVRLILIDTASYTYDAAHEFLSSVPSGARAAVSSSLTGKNIAAATAAFKSDDKTFASVPAGPACEALIMYLHTGSDATARLIAYLDTGVTGLPITPDGSPVQVTPASGGWYTL